jgi:transcriptional regulator with XRE-family HTH domain
MEEFAEYLRLSLGRAESIEEGRSEVSPELFYRVARVLRLRDDDAHGLFGAAEEAHILSRDWVVARPLTDWSEETLLGTMGGAILMRMLSGKGPSREVLDAEGRATMARLRRAFQLNSADIAQMLAAEPSDIDSWDAGTAHIPLVVVAQLREYADALDVLEGLFTEDRLPRVIRRPAQLFGGATALDLIRRGDLQTVATRYNHALQFAG